MKSIGYYMLKCWADFQSIQPYWLLYMKSDVCYFLTYHVVRYRRKVVRENLLRSFPEKEDKEIKAIEKHFYRNLCDLFVEAPKMMCMGLDGYSKRITYTDTEALDRLIEQKKSIFFAIPHSGNWEWFGKLMQTFSAHHPMALYKKVKSPVFERFIYELRTSLPVEMIESNSALRALAQRTGQLDQVMILADQSPQGLKTDYWTEFLHQDTCWFTGLERMAKYLDYAVVFVAMKRVRRGYYELTFQPITETPKETEKGYIMEQYARHIERFIQEQPDNWLWSHRRWKHVRNQEVE